MEANEILPVGIEEIDVQHSRLVDIVNDMYAEVSACKSLDEEAAITGRFIKELCEYAKLHFAPEEQLMTRGNYSLLSQHQTEHAGFIKKMTDLQHSHENGEPALSFDVFSFARSWIISHVNVSDQKYVTSR
jgi:hemerythrin-like metal-binding protein